MKPLVLLLTCTLYLVMSSAANAQRPGGNNNNNRPGTSSSPNIPPARTTNPNISSEPRITFLSGKVVVDDGSELTDSAVVESVCRGQRRFETYTDRKGNFSFELGKRRGTENMYIDSDVSRPSPNPNFSESQNGLGGGQDRRDLTDCELQAVLPGFTSQILELAGFQNSQIANVGNISLHRIARVEGFTISATTAMAPGKARKAFEKGLDDKKNKKFDAAEKKFQEAVNIYPKFAAAWLELGRIQLQNKDTAAARQSLAHAIEADCQFVSPHQELALINFNEKRWHDVVDETDQILKLNPISFPQDWFLNAVGNYYLQKLDVAEKSARQGLKADVEHRIPRLEYVLGVILANKHNYPEAMEHLRAYLRLAPNSSDAKSVNDQIVQLEKLAPPTAAAPQPK